MLGHRDNKRNHYSFYLTRKQRSSLQGIYTLTISFVSTLQELGFLSFFSSSKFTISVMLTRARR